MKAFLLAKSKPARAISKPWVSPVCNLLRFHRHVIKFKGRYSVELDITAHSSARELLQRPDFAFTDPNHANSVLSVIDAKELLKPCRNSNTAQLIQQSSLHETIEAELLATGQERTRLLGFQVVVKSYLLFVVNMKMMKLFWLRRASVFPS
jgi:hypothetical protein